MKTFKAVALGLAVILLVLFVAQNLSYLTYAEPLKLNLLFFTWATPPIMVSLVVLAALAVGFFAAWALGFTSQHRMRKTLKGLEKRQVRSEEELHRLRNLPITSDPVSTVGPGEQGV